MHYIEVTIFTNKLGLEIINASLLAIGIDSIVINDPDDILDLLNKKNEYDWDYVDESVISAQESEPYITVYVEDNAEGRRQLSQIQQMLAELRRDVLQKNLDLGSLNSCDQRVNDDQWKNTWKQYFKPAKITERIIVKPTWESYTKTKEDEIVIEIDPGMAFGTGTHETTSCCMRLLEKYIKLDCKVLDVGSGSGILSIAARLLGAGVVLGVEIDPEAVVVGQENVRLNGVADSIEIVKGDLTKGLDFCADIVVANLMADLIKLLSKDIAKHLVPGGIYISSGILTELGGDIAAHIQRSGFAIMETLIDGEWCAIAARYTGGGND